MLRYRSDLSSLACALASVSFQLAWLATGKLLFLVPMVVALRWTALVQHNHSHVTMFRRPLPNRLLDLALGTVTGMPMELYREAHGRTHHRHTGTPLDWTQPTELEGRVAVQTRPLKRWRYWYVFVVRGWRLGWQGVGQDTALAGRLAAEGAAMILVLSVALAAGAPLRLLAVVGLWAVVAGVSADANYKHHRGYLTAEDRTSFANDTFSLLHATLGFNIGYHSTHHGRPGAHWSKLPGLSARTPDPSLRQPA